MPCHLDPLAARLLQLLPVGGGSMGNGALQRMLGEASGQPLDLEAYVAVRDSLLAGGRRSDQRPRPGWLLASV